MEEREKEREKMEHYSNRDRDIERKLYLEIERKNESKRETRR